MAVRSWENNWEDLATMFEYGTEIRRLIYTTNSIEGYNRQLRKVTKTKGAFPTDEAARKLLFLANSNITKKWTAPVPNWACIRNQLAIRFAGRFPM
jgi:putative transposase